MTASQRPATVPACVGLEAAACRGEWELFDSTDLFDHRQAAAICATCPAIIACRGLLAEQAAIGKTLRECGGGPRGTWAGLLIGKNPASTRAKCGTESGYKRHRRMKLAPCKKCKAAHAKAEAKRVRKLQKVAS